MPTINIPDKIPTKICKTCKEEREILLFAIKHKNERLSVCRLCKANAPFSFYIYQNKENQELAKKNNKIINNHLRRIRLNHHICSCGSIRELGKSFCNTCKLNKIKKNNLNRNNRKKTVRTAEQESIRLRKKIKNLNLSYVKSVIKQSIKDTNNLIIKSKDIPQELVEMKRNQLLLKRKIKNNDNKEEQHSN